mgnify:FL=1
MTDANEQTAKSPNAPKRGRPFGRKSPADAAILALQQQLAELKGQLGKKEGIESVIPGPEVKPGQTPGRYAINVDPDSGMIKPGVKTRWSREAILNTYQLVTFTPMVSMPVKPHGMTKGGWELIAGEAATVPSIVKDIYDNAIRAVSRQTAAYPGASAAQEQQIFDATLKTKGPHFTPVKHVGFGWSESALQAAARGTIDPSHEPEVGFPQGEEVKV